MEERIRNYWHIRTKDFKKVRVNELENDISHRWYEYINQYIKDKPLKILDIGTGVGYFILLLGKVHEMTGIDLTPSMIEEAKELANMHDTHACLKVGDAMHLDFGNETYDMILSRNLTWTLPDIKQAYKEWYRVLKPGGILLNFDACYHENVKKHKHVPQGHVYGHLGMNEELEKENAEITLTMDASSKNRPEYDQQILQDIGFKQVNIDQDVGQKVLQENDLKEAPMFCIVARK